MPHVHLPPRPLLSRWSLSLAVRPLLRLALVSPLARPAAPVGFAVLATLAIPACDKDTPRTEAVEAAATPAVSTATSPPDPPRAPDIVIDSTNVAVGNDRIGAGEPGLADKLAVFVSGRPMIEGQVVSVVVLRNAKPSGPLALLSALRRAKATGAVIRTDGRDGTTQKLPIAFSSPASAPPDCATVAWIGHDAAINVWPAGGGTARRVVKGLAGPDMTLGGEAVQKQLAGCSASQIFVGEDEALTWGLAFDLATAALAAPGCRASAAVLVPDAVPGRKLALPAGP